MYHNKKRTDKERKKIKNVIFGKNRCKEDW